MFMADEPDKTLRRRQRLAEIAERGIEEVQELHARAMAADDPAEFERLIAAFCRAGDTVRGTIEQSMRIERQQRRLEHERRLREVRRAEARRRAEEAMRARVAAAGAPWPEDPSRH